MSPASGRRIRTRAFAALNDVVAGASPVNETSFQPSAAPTDKEAADLFRSCLAYAGRYTIDGNVVTHHVDISWNESWTGTQQIRIATFKGNRVELSTKPTPDPVSGRMSVRTITWEKMSPETSL